MRTGATITSEQATAGCAQADVDAFVDASLRQAAGSDRYWVIRIPARPTRATSLLEALPSDTASLWEAPSGDAVASVGEAARIEVRGATRFSQLREGAESLFRRLEVAAHPSASKTRVRLWGGMAFSEGSASEPIWRGFGDGQFSLPRWVYERSGSDAHVELAVHGTELDVARRAELVGELHLIERSLAAPPSHRLEGAAHPVLQVEHESTQAWRSRVEAARKAVRSGDLEKVVLARRSVAKLSRIPDVSLIAERLGQRFPNCMRFMLQRGDGAFIGSTPEWLVQRFGRRVSSEAMAGSAQIGHGAALLTSLKDRQEHQLVVDAIVRRLTPVAAHLDWPSTPQVVQLSNVEHLHTPIRGRLEGDTHVLELVETLHPTPAIGGAPGEAAQAWIHEHELCKRGWYSGPLGWFDREGDGQFVVALRSGLLRGGEAYLYAGAGILAESDPDAEYVETELKLDAMLRALDGTLARRFDG